MDVSDVPAVPEWLPDHLRADGVESLYPPQAEAVEAGVTEGNSLVASIPTASGKTLIATLAMLAAVRSGGTALYIVPLRALASEKRAEFEQFEEYGVSVGVSTGNYDDDGEWLAEKDIIVATSEKVDSLVRNGAPWLGALDCVVADEVHLVDDPNRGPTLEVTLAKLRSRNPDLQVVALSATIGNAAELAAWLDAELVDSSWRPIELRKGVHYGQALHFDDGTQAELPVGSGEKPTAAIVRDTLRDTVEDGEVVEAGGSTLVFVNSRRNAEAAARRLSNTTADALDGDELAALAEVAEGIRGVSDTETSDDLADAVEKGAAFHHAGLCVTGDTQILRPDGTIEPISQVVEHPDGGAVGLDEYDLESVDITDTFEMGERPVLQVTTRTGNRLRLSSTHPLPTLGADGIEWVPAGSIERGEYIARPRRLDVDPEPPTLRSLIPDQYRVYRQYEAVERVADEVDLDRLDVTYRESYTKSRNITVGDFRTLCRAGDEASDDYLGEVMCRSGRKPISIPRELGEDICWLAGAVAGDGYLDENKVVLTGKSNTLREFERIVAEQFDRSTRNYTSPSETPMSVLGSKIVSEIFSTHFGIPCKGDGERQLPTVALSDDLLGAYLSGLFDADGTVSPRPNEEGSPCIEFYTTSEAFATQLKTALLRFGIVAYRDTRDKKGQVNEHDGREIRSRSDVERLTIYGVDQLRRFSERIGFRHESKAESVEDAIKRNPDGGRGQTDLIPSSLGSELRTVRERLGLSMNDLEPAVAKATLSRFENDETPMKRETFQRLADNLNESRFSEIAESGLYWDRVETTESQETEPLYDLSTSSGNFVANGFIAHNTSAHRELVEDAFRDRLVKCVCATPTLAAGVNTPSRRVVVRDWRRYSGDAGGMQPLSVLEVHQMMGRAGRPGMDPYGEALLLANSHDELDELFERYVWAEPEPVRSKLAAEPAMRTHLLATIASGFADSRETLREFLDGTLYATQTDEQGRLERVMDDMLAYLRANDFIQESDGRLTATSLGHTVSRLYLDPMSAATIVDGLREADDPSALGLYHLVCRTPDMYQLYLRSGERETYTEEAYERETELLGETPSEFEESRFDDWLSALKTAKLLEDWASETDEDRITERYGVGPGDIRGKVDTAEWLLGAAESLAGELDLGDVTAVREANKRVQYGVREELIDLAGVRNVGRKRARRLYEAGVETPSELRNAEKPVVLAALRGRRRTAETVLENAGHQSPSMEGVTPDPDAAPDGEDGATGGASTPAAENDQSSLGDF